MNKFKEESIISKVSLVEKSFSKSKDISCIDSLLEEEPEWTRWIDTGVVLEELSEGKFEPPEMWG